MFLRKIIAGGVRLSCQIDIDGDEDILFLECESKWKKYLLTERADAFVVLLLPIAMRENHDIISKLPITEDLKNNLENKLIAELVKHDKTLYQTKIVADTENESIGGIAVGTANSLGVDSFYTINKYGNCEDENKRITHFYMGRISYDLWRTKAKDLFDYMKKKKHMFDRYKLVADELGKELIITFSNFVWFVCNKHKNIHVTLHNFIAYCEVLCFAKLWRTYLFSGAYSNNDVCEMKDIRNISSEHYAGIIANAISNDKFVINITGGEVTRHEKTVILADYEPAQKYLRPCFNSYRIKKDMKNCGKFICPKCLRLLVSADVSGNLEKFKNVVNINKYKRSRWMYFLIVIWGKDDSSFLKELYDLCIKKYPKKIKRIEKFVNFLKFKWFNKKDKKA